MSAIMKFTTAIMRPVCSSTNKDPKFLEVYSLQLAGAILPFVYYFGSTINDKDFIKFVKFSTTNSNIFYDFARYMAKNYVFNGTTKASAKAQEKYSR